MLQVKTYVDKSSIHGIGLFADQDIKEGTLIWKFDGKYDRIILVSEIDNYRDFFDMYSERKGDIKLLCGDNARFMNHSETPNLLDPDFWTCIAARDISKGEELTCNYASICDDEGR